jgi:hypothetical protein
VIHLPAHCEKLTKIGQIANDQGRLRAMRTALLKLARRYGPEGFAPDVLDLLAEEN